MFPHEQEYVLKQLQALLQHPRVKMNKIDAKENPLEDLIGTGLADKLDDHITMRARKLFQEARKWRSIRDGTEEKRKNQNECETGKNNFTHLDI